MADDDVALLPHEIWWRVFLARLSQVEAALPPTLRGSIQFAVKPAAMKDGASSFFFLKLTDRGPIGQTGVVSEPDAWVDTSEDQIVRLLDASRDPAGAFETSGNVGLFKTLLESMAKVPPAASIVGIRIQK
jgi:hypothetical protein